jgi:hypothetical protein
VFWRGGRGKNGRNRELIAWRCTFFLHFFSHFRSVDVSYGRMHAHTDRTSVGRFCFLLFLPLVMLSLIISVLVLSTGLPQQSSCSIIHVLKKWFGLPLKKRFILDLNLNPMV